MSRALSIRFQPSEHLSGPARDLFAELRKTASSKPIAGYSDQIAPIALPPSPAQEQLDARTLRRRLRTLERERTLKAVDGTSTWIITDRMAFNPDLGERVGHHIVGTGLGKGRIVYGPHDLSLPAGRYMAVIELQVTNMVDRGWARATGEVVLKNQKYLSQQTKLVLDRGKYTFRLPFRVREADLLQHAASILQQTGPIIEVRLNLRSVVGVEVTQVAVVSKASGIRAIAAHPVAHLKSTGNACLRWIGRSIWRRSA